MLDRSMVCLRFIGIWLPQINNLGWFQIEILNGKRQVLVVIVILLRDSVLTMPVYVFVVRHSALACEFPEPSSSPFWLTRAINV